MEVESRNAEYKDSEDMRSYIRQAAQFLTDGKHCGLMLCGTTGNGKTTIAKAIRSLVNAYNIKDENGEKFYFRLHSSKDIVRMAKADYVAYLALCHCPAIIIDDLGEEPIEVLEYGNSLNPVIDMLSIRYEEQLLTIVTTNTAAAQIRERYGDRIADRFNEMMQVIIFTNPSFRGR